MPATTSRTSSFLEHNVAVSIRGNTRQVSVTVQLQNQPVCFLSYKRQALNVLGVITTNRLTITMRLRINPVLLTRPRRVTLRSVRSEEHTSELQSRGHLVC